MKCLLLGHIWVYPTAEERADGVPVKCQRCGRLMPDMRPGSKHLPHPPEDKMRHGAETKRRKR